MFADWTRPELLQLAAIAVSGMAALLAFTATVYGFRNGKKGSDVHVLFNSPLTEFLRVTRAGAQAAGMEQARVESDARALAKEARGEQREVAKEARADAREEKKM